MMQNFFRSAGFTLLEVLIALAITSFIVTALYGTFFLSQKAIDSIDDSLIRLQAARTVVDNLKRELESAYHLSGSEYPLFKLEDRDFYGRSASRITFTAFSPLTAGLAKVSYNVKENDGKLMLKKSISSAFPSKTKTKDVELLEDIHSFSIEVKFRDKWVKTWDSKTTNGIPEDIRIAVTFFSKNRDARKEGRETVSVFDFAKPMIGKTNIL